MSSGKGPEIHVPFASLLPTAKSRGEVLLAGSAGVVARRVDPALVSARERPLTRRAVLTEAFSFLHRPYGWGDYAGGRDCSRFLMDMFGGLGLVLPRHTSDQALAGAVEDLAPDLPEAERLRRIDAAHRRGVVLLHFPGHIMLYLGRDDAGTAMAIHSFAEYLVPCAGRPDGAPAGERETLLKVDGVHVSDLELGRGTSRGAFIQRISKITVLVPPAPEPRP
nr:MULTISPECIES: NlpC/P60 family protein [unclassified Nannocystis]